MLEKNIEQWKSYSEYRCLQSGLGEKTTSQKTSFIAKSEFEFRELNFEPLRSHYLKKNLFLLLAAFFSLCNSHCRRPDSADEQIKSHTKKLLKIRREYECLGCFLRLVRVLCRIFLSLVTPQNQKRERPKSLLPR